MCTEFLLHITKSLELLWVLTSLCFSGQLFYFEISCLLSSSCNYLVSHLFFFFSSHLCLVSPWCMKSVCLSVILLWVSLVPADFPPVIYFWIWFYSGRCSCLLLFFYRLNHFSLINYYFVFVHFTVLYLVLCLHLGFILQCEHFLQKPEGLLVIVLLYFFLCFVWIYWVKKSQRCCHDTNTLNEVLLSQPNHVCVSHIHKSVKFSYLYSNSSQNSCVLCCVSCFRLRNLQHLCTSLLLFLLIILVTGNLT